VSDVIEPGGGKRTRTGRRLLGEERGGETGGGQNVVVMVGGWRTSDE